MNKYCVNLNISTPLFVEEFDIDSLRQKRHSGIPANAINPLLYKLFNDRGLRIELAEAFFIPKFSRIVIHEDGGDSPDVLKVNWVIGGAGSLMHWYNPIVDPIWKTTVLGISYKSYELSQVKLLHSQPVGFPSLVQVGCPHNVATAGQERLCISILPAFKGSTSNTITFEKGLELFKDLL